MKKNLVEYPNRIFPNTVLIIEEDDWCEKVNKTIKNIISHKRTNYIKLLSYTDETFEEAESRLLKNGNLKYYSSLLNRV